MSDQTATDGFHDDAARLDRLGAVDADRDSMRSALDVLEAKGGHSFELTEALIRLGTLEREMGNLDEAEVLFRKALNISESTQGSDDAGLVLALTGLGTTRMLARAHDEAKSFFDRALSISENLLPESQPDFVILLNDLARLCLKQSAYTLAEPFLLRLLAMKRNKGEDHPEVATVIASLAIVHQALGRHESAEQMWRHVLEVRERTLAPNHYGIATALEHLADVCAARGKLREALELLQRGLSIRELTLGADHASLRISRERHADLQLQASEDSLGPQDADSGVAAPGAWGNLVGENRTPSAPPSPTRSRTLSLRSLNTAPVMEPRQSMEAAAGTAVARRGGEGETSEMRRPELGVDSYRSLLLSMTQDAGGKYQTQTLRERASAILGSVLDLARKRRKTVEIGAVPMVLLLVALASRAWGANDHSTTVVQTAPGHVSPPVAAAGPQPALPREIVPISVRLKDSSNHVASARSLTSPLPRVVIHAAAPKRSKESETGSDRKKVSIPSFSKKGKVNLDSVADAIAAPTGAVGESILLQAAARGPNTQRPSFAYADPGNGPLPASLIGRMPTPDYPAHLVDVEGVVRIQFMVDTVGRPIMPSFLVVSSPNALLTTSVRKVIPGMRFVPARTGGPNSKAKIGSVEVAFKFVRGASNP